MKKLAIAIALLGSGCQTSATYDAPTAIVLHRATAQGGHQAAVEVHNLDRAPAYVRLYAVPATYADAAQRDIEADGGRLGRWAGAVVGSAEVTGQKRQHVAIRARAGCCDAGELLVLAIDPIRSSSFVFADARVETSALARGGRHGD